MVFGLGTPSESKCRRKIEKARKWLNTLTDIINEDLEKKKKLLALKDAPIPRINRLTKNIEHRRSLQDDANNEIKKWQAKLDHILTLEKTKKKVA